VGVLALVFNFVPVVCYGKRNPLTGTGQEKFELKSFELCTVHIE
jgi:hypothetical protein